MTNSIHVSGTGSLESLLTGLQKKTEKTAINLSYKDMLTSIQTQMTENIDETKSTADMTMEEFQDYIWNKIDSFPFSPTRPYDEETIIISDKCWERMKSDTEYEEKMMNLIKEGRAYPDPFFGMSGNSGAYWVLEFDGGEGCKSHGFSKNFGGSAENASKQFEKESENGFWSNRRLQKKKLQTEIEEMVHEKREIIQAINEEVALNRKIISKQGVMEGAPELPITGIPAKFLLAGLG